jgi:hypothetical protein
VAKRSAAAKLSRLAIGIASGVAPKALIKRLRPAELEYLCELCSLLQELHLCDDDEFDFEEEDD